MKMFSKDGVEMMDVKSIAREGDVLVMKGKMMGAMIMTIHVRPEDLWQSVKLMSFSTICYLPVLLIKGMMKSRGA
jgi:hypothetical protein